MSRTFYITTLGCPKNQADTRAMEESLLREGLTPVASAEHADLHLINSCAFVEEARLETIDTVFEAAELKAERPEQKLILAGCFAERYAKEVQGEMPEVDFSFGTGRYSEAGALLRAEFGTTWHLSQLNTAASRRPLGGDGSRGSFLPSGAEPREPRQSTGQTAGGVVLPPLTSVSAPVKISDGCNRTCAFCAIPSFRGAFRDRPVADIVNEVSGLVARGVREVCLVSQDTNAFGNHHERLVELLEELHGVDGLAWIRLLYLYPDKRTERMLSALENRRLSKLVPYFESPVQHASERVLKSMRRSGSAGQFKDLFAQARALWPEAEVRTTFLLGFPGETSSDVDEILDFIEVVRPEKLALFPYSPEEGTSGAGLTETVDPEEAISRVNLVRATHLRVLKEIHQARVGRTYDCMIEEVGDEMIGRRPQDAPEVDEVVYVQGLTAALPGDILRVRITGFFEYDMTAVPTALREPA